MKFWDSKGRRRTFWGRKGNQRARALRPLRSKGGRRPRMPRAQSSTTNASPNRQDPTLRNLTEDFIEILNRKSNATSDKSKETMVQTHLSRLQSFLCFLAEKRDGSSVSRVSRIYEPLLFASTRPDLLELFADTVLVKTEGLRPSTVLNWLVDLKKSVCWAVQYHRKTCGSAVPYAFIVSYI